MRLLLKQAATLFVAALLSGSAAAQNQRPALVYDVPLEIGDGKHLIVHGTVNGLVSGPMLVDTGSSYCVLTRATARRLGFALPRGTTVPVVTANGEVEVDRFHLPAVQLAGARVTAVETVVMDAVEPPLIGIVGLSLLNRFRYSVDVARGTLRLER